MARRRLTSCFLLLILSRKPPLKGLVLVRWKRAWNVYAIGRGGAFAFESLFKSKKLHQYLRSTVRYTSRYTTLPGLILFSQGGGGQGNRSNAGGWISEFTYDCRHCKCVYGFWKWYLMRLKCVEMYSVVPGLTIRISFRNSGVKINFTISEKYISDTDRRSNASWRTFDHLDRHISQ